MAKPCAGRPAAGGKKRAAPTSGFPGLEPLETRVLLSGNLPSHATRRPEPLQPMFIMAPADGSLTPASSQSPSGVTPAQMRHFYGIDQVNFKGIVGDGTGQSIAIVDAYNDPTASSDLHAFDQAFNLPDPPSLQQVNQSGGTSLPGSDPNHGTNNSWEIEESIDIEWAHVIAPKASLILVEANSALPPDLYTASRTAANLSGVVAVSMSWGGPEDSSDTSNDNIYFKQPANHIGVTFLAATGDNGVGTYPAYSPNVVAVGGTTMHFASDGISYGSETAWSGSGGGTSIYEPSPSYQPSGFRTTPDVAMDADPASGVPVYDSFDFGASAPWAKFGGTSLATPMWAGLIAIADQGRGTSFGGQGALTQLYSLPQSDFHDITSGSNTNFRAGPGYDEVTGRGTPLANVLLNDMAGVPSASTVVGQYIFYNDSSYDGKDPATNAADDAAIATDKTALLPGQTATFANYTSYTGGINGIMIDVSGMTGTPTAADFTFLVGNTADPSTWSTAPAPASLVVRPGAGASGSARVEITWADGTLRNEWLQVTMNADTVTALAAPDVFYFGNLIGETGKPAISGFFTVTPDDVTSARNDPHTFLNPASITDGNDFNRDRRVDALDQLIARLNGGSTLIDLGAPTPAAPVSPAAAPSSAVYTASGWWSANETVRRRRSIVSITLPLQDA
ncbi:MAG TPA: S53 family peptidase [Tepidisphaeraceae bacterium]|nr:S53 family peptidase [Tepidisphaeraceae bacterium]